MRIYPELLVDQEFKSLGDQGFMGTLNDRQFAFLRSKGYVNALADMMTSWLSWSPANLFSLSEPGIWLDPSDVANLDWRRNLLTYTEQFDNAAWVKSNTNATANAAVAPDGTTTAETLLNAATAAAQVTQQNIAVPSGISTYSTYCKAGTVNFVSLRTSGFDADITSSFNLSSGAVFSQGAGHTASITPAGSGWYRCVVSFSTASDLIGNVHAYINADGGSVFDADLGANGTSSILIWGAQLELGSVATDYQRISNVNTEVLERFPTTTMFQDSAGTTAVTTPGQSVGLVLDKSKGLVLGPQLVTNGTFDADTSGWTASNSTLSVVSGRLRVTDAGAASAAYQGINVVVGKTYRLNLDYLFPSSNAASDYEISVRASTFNGSIIVEKKTGLVEDVETNVSLIFTPAVSTVFVRLSPSSTTGDTADFDNISVKELPGNHVAQPTAAARPRYIVDADGTFIQHDLVDDALTVTLPDMGTEATVAYVTRSEVRLLEDQTISGSYTLPKQEIAGFIAIDRALTQAEKINVIRYLASKVEGVNYGAEIDRLTLIAINAVDVFVYDTSKDSDGGAWRAGALAQASSWYNETLNTATRGARREFPAVAVIVAQAAKVTIYDGDDPALPMWMVFNEGNFNNLVFGFNSLSAKNGILCSGNSEGNSNYAGLMVVRFIADDLIGVRNSTYPNGHPSIFGVVNRNSAWPQAGSRGLITSGGGLPNVFVNDVAMTVLPDAPIDPATGLPVPTIAVATAGGVSVIKDDGTVVDLTHTFASGNAAFDIDLDSSGRLSWASRDIASNGVYLFVENSIPASDKSTAPDIIYTPQNISGGALRYSGNNSPYCTGFLPNAIGTSTGGITHLDENPATPSKGMVAYTTSTYNTGWMNGNIKGAFLSDTDDTDLVGSGELVTNGTFDTDVSGWTDSTAFSSTFDSNTINVAYTTGAGGSFLVGAFQTISTVVGKTYVLTADVTAVSSNLARIRVETTLGGGQNGQVNNVGVGSYTLTFTATATTTYINLCMQADATGSVNYDNVSVKLADADRSVNNKGLIINGTVTRSPVATGADLVAYSGFSASNYLEQPYNSGLDFGTGDFCVMGWVKAADTGATNTSILIRSGATGLGKIRVRSRLGKFAMWISDDGASTIDEVISTSDIDNNNWNFVCSVRQGSFIYAYVNGSLETTASVVNAAGSLSSSDATTRVGISDAGTEPWTGSLALIRISATAPTASQIEKIYNDEKFLFQENAQATLYGASDAVTALAFDDTTQMLHVGTSAGRSVFSGLRRVSNTTTAVGTAISASNGLVVEE